MAILQAMLTLIDGFTMEAGAPVQTAISIEGGDLATNLEKIFILAFTWSFGALLEAVVASRPFRFQQLEAR